MNSSQSDQRLIVALDMSDSDTARDLVNELGSLVNFYKIGLAMLCAGGFELAMDLKQKYHKRVFLDLKLFDIDATISAAVHGIVSSLAPDFLTVHGDPHIVSAAIKARGATATQILAVTILTSQDRSDLDAAMLTQGSVQDIVVERANRALACGADGVICSPLEACHIRSLATANGKLIVTPGTRPHGAPQQGQKRVSTPAEAIRNGANHLVIGRPITQSTNRRQTVRQILEELP